MALKKLSEKSNPQKGKKRSQVDIPLEYLPLIEKKAKKRHMKIKAYYELVIMQDAVKKD